MRTKRGKTEQECPKKLRTQIVQWTRFQLEHEDENLRKHEMINSLPYALQKMLVQHLYKREMSRVPLFAFLERCDDTIAHSDILQEDFIHSIFVQLQYSTYLPDQVLEKRESKGGASAQRAATK